MSILTGKPYFLSVGCLFKNESDSIVEWIEHYIDNGVEHFFLINDDSTDNSVELLQPYIDSGLVTLFNAVWGNYLGRQKDMYNCYIFPEIQRTQWIIIVDMDEYLWSRDQRDLRLVFNQCGYYGQVQFNHTVFGSNGHIQQPKGIVKNFTKRKDEAPILSVKNLKYAINTNFSFNGLNVHHADFSDPHNQMYDFKIIDAPYFILNHYCCQSREFWDDVKCCRGDSDHYRVRLPEQFDEFDFNEVEDTELAERNIST